MRILEYKLLFIIHNRKIFILNNESSNQYDNASMLMLIYDIYYTYYITYYIIIYYILYIIYNNLELKGNKRYKCQNYDDIDDLH